MALDLGPTDSETLRQAYGPSLQQQADGAAYESTWQRRKRALHRWGLPALIGLLAAIIGHLLVQGYQHLSSDHDLLHTLVNIEVQRRQPTPAPTLPK